MEAAGSAPTEEVVTLGRYGYRFPRSRVSRELHAAATSQLSVMPIVNEAFAQSAVPVRVWLEGRDGSLYVPPLFGRKWRQARPDWAGHLRDGEYRKGTSPPISPMRTGVSFRGVLDPRLHQPEATAAALQALRTDGRCMVAQHTGAGKTVCALAVAAELGLKTLVIVHKAVLMDQWEERVRTFLPNARVGKVCQDLCESEGYDVVIAMVQSVERRNYPGLTDHGLLILDEVHRFAAACFSRILFKVNAPHVLGLSATPERRDGLTPVIEWWLGDVVFRLERENQGHVRVWTVYTNLKIPVKINRQGRVDMCGLINSMCDHDKRNELLRSIVRDLLRDGRAILFLTDRRAHAEMLTRAFPDQALLMLGGCKLREPVTAKNRLICSSYALAKEGLDFNHLDTLVLSTPKSDVNQICGRILREHHRRSHDPLIVDIIDDVSVCYAQHRKRQGYYSASGFSESH